MTFKEFYIEGKEGKSNCVIRSLCKILNKEYNMVYNDLINLAKKLNSSSFNDIEVFETYMKENNIYKIDYKEDTKIKDLNLDNGSYVIFCYDKKEFYHMITIIDNVVYDRTIDCMNLYVISIYKKL